MHAGFAIIKEEHRTLAAVLDGLLHLTRAVGDGKMKADVKLLGALLDYIELFPLRLHHPKEDQFLFPALRRHGADANAVLDELQVGRVWMPVTYFALWMNRLMGWMPELGRCAACGLDLRGGTVWYSAVNDGVTCADDRSAGGTALSAESVATAARIFRGTVKGLAEEDWPKARAAELRRFAIEVLERHLEGRLMTARVLARG